MLSTAPQYTEIENWIGILKNVDKILTNRTYDSPDKTGSGVPGGPIQWSTLKSGAILLIVCDGISIIVDVEKLTNGLITAKVRGFENTIADDVQGIKPDEKIQFSEIKVHSISC